jgi:AcrR family transcriptional regulator
MASGMTRRRQQALNTRKLLLESALFLFKEKGYGSVTVEDIARRAGTAKGSFYSHFQAKSDIIIEEFRAIDDYYRAWAKNLRRYRGAVARLSAFTRAQLRYVRDKVGLETLKILYVNNISEPGAEKILIDESRYLQQLVRLIVEEGQAAGELRADVPAQRLAQLYNRAFRSVFLDWAISDDAFDLVKEGLEFCETVVLPALRPRQG